MFYVANTPTDPDVKWFKKNPGRLYRFRKATREEMPELTPEWSCIEDPHFYILAYQVAQELEFDLVMGLKICTPPILDDQDEYDLSKDSDLQEMAFNLGGKAYLDYQDELHEAVAAACSANGDVGLRQIP